LSNLLQICTVAYLCEVEQILTCGA